MGWWDKVNDVANKPVDDTGWGTRPSESFRLSNILSGQLGGSVGKAVGSADPLKAFDRASSVPDPGSLDTKKAEDLAQTATVGTPSNLPNTQITRQANAFDLGQAAQANTNSMANPYLQGNLELLQKLASGQGGSVAQNQLQQGREANIAATMAQTASQRGGFNPLLARQALQSGATQNAQANQQAATQRLQEQMAATQALSQQGTTMRGQDIAVSQANAQMQTQVSLENMRAQLEQAKAQGQISAQQANQIYAAQAQAMAQTETLRAQYMQMGYNAEQANIAAKMAMNNAQTQKQAAIIGGLTSFFAPSASFMGFGANNKSSTPATAGGPNMSTDMGAGMGSSGLDGGTAGAAAADIGGVMAAHGGMVPGKAPKEGDHPENDIVPARLSPGEFVLPRSLTQDKELMALVHKKMAEHQVKKSHVTASQGFADVLKAHAELNAKMDALKKFMGGD